MNEYWEGLPVLVTGATGFIGSHLTRELVRLGARVSILVCPSSSLWRLEDFEAEIKIFRADITEPEQIENIICQVEPKVVFHLAAKVDLNRSSELLPKMMRVNFQGTVNLLTALQKTSYQCFINTGSSEEYGTNQAPFEESKREQPVSPYSFSKLAATHYCQMLHRTQGAPVVTLRPFLTYGPYQTGSMLVPALVRHCLEEGSFPLTPGEQTRDFNYISDIVQGYLKAATSRKAVGEVINLGNSLEYKVRQVVLMAIRLSASKLEPKFGAFPYRTGEAMRVFCSGQKASDLLNWKPTVSLEEGLRETIAWHRQWKRKQQEP